MALRMIRGETNPIVVPATANTAISVGDLLYLASNKALPASSFAYSNSTGETQETFHDVFLGVSMDARLASNSTAGNILVATTGVAELPCTDTASAYDVGQLFGVAMNGTTSCKSQEVVAVATANLAIGRAVEEVAGHATTVKLNLWGTLPTGGPQNAA